MSEATTAPRGGSSYIAGLLGGVAGAVLTAAVLVFAAPQLVGPRLVRQALLSNPRILVETADALRDQQYAPTLAQYRRDLETPFGSSWKGSDKPDITLVEFFDYACGYCRASNPHIDRLVAEDPKLRVVYREFPILGADSVAAARLSLAASKIGRFRQFHDSLYAAGRPSPETLTLAARAAGLPPQAGTDPSAEAELKRNFELAGQLGATGTPLFVVGNKVMNSAVGYDALKKAVADARAAKS
ncbi:MAG: DsbA family protein [Sphingomicrobium sp.]